MSNKKSYNDLKKELDDEITWFDSDEVSLEEAPKHYKKAQQLLKEIEELLKSIELEIKKLN